MKKKSLVIISLFIALSLLVACGDGKKESTSKGNTEKEINKVVIGVSPDPHAKIVELIKEDLKDEGIDLEIKQFTDYVIPNKSLDEGDLDLNFFQHLPYLEEYNENNNTNLVSLGGVHIEPIALYSNRIEEIDELKENSEIAIPNDAVNGGRALLLLEANNLIKLKEGVGLEATEKDIIDNPLNLKFTSLEAANLPRILQDVDAAVINGNYAIGSGLNPLTDGILIEDKDSPYVNVLVSHVDNQDKESLLKVMEFLNSEKVRDFILKEYNGAVIPAFD